MGFCELLKNSQYLTKELLWVSLLVFDFAIRVSRSKKGHFLLILSALRLRPPGNDFHFFFKMGCRIQKHSCPHATFSEMFWESLMWFCRSCSITMWHVISRYSCCCYVWHVWGYGSGGGNGLIRFAKDTFSFTCMNTYYFFFFTFCHVDWKRRICFIVTSQICRKTNKWLINK